MMRSLENTIYFASVNYALRFQESATSLIAPSGECQAYLPYGQEGVLVQAIDVERRDGFAGVSIRTGAVSGIRCGVSPSGPSGRRGSDPTLTGRVILTNMSSMRGRKTSGGRAVGPGAPREGLRVGLRKAPSRGPSPAG